MGHIFSSFSILSQISCWAQCLYVQQRLKRISFPPEKACVFPYQGCFELGWGQVLPSVTLSLPLVSNFLESVIYCVCMVGFFFQQDFWYVKPETSFFLSSLLSTHSARVFLLEIKRYVGVLALHFGLFQILLCCAALHIS